MFKTSNLFQSIVTQINHAIGAEGVVSMECKQIVSEYGDMIWDLLVSGVCSFFPSCNLSFVSSCKNYSILFVTICSCNLAKFVRNLDYVLLVELLMKGRNPELLLLTSQNLKNLQAGG